MESLKCIIKMQNGFQRCRPGNEKKKDRKIAKNQKYYYISSRGAQRKEDRKIALLRLCVLYLYHVWKSRESPRPPLPTLIMALQHAYREI